MTLHMIFIFGLGYKHYCLFRLQKSAHLFSGHPWLQLPQSLYAIALLGSMSFSIRYTC
jgi:hypothetical protein